MAHVNNVQYQHSLHKIIPAQIVPKIVINAQQAHLAILAKLVSHSLLQNNVYQSIAQIKLTCKVMTV